jgi:phage baseplate assembly protein W
MAIVNYRGFGFPIQKSSYGYFHRTNDLALIKADLIQLLLTEPGERVMFPQYGTGLRGFVFEPNDIALSQSIQEKVANAITNWEPRVVVTRIEVKFGEGDDVDDDKMIKVEVDFSLKTDLGTVETLQLSLNKTFNGSSV